MHLSHWSPVLLNTSSPSLALLSRHELRGWCYDEMHFTGVYYQELDALDVTSGWELTRQANQLQMCPPVFWEEISEEERQSSLCFSPERPRFLRWSAETANLLSSKDSSCLKVTECLFHHFLRNAPYAARVRPNDEPFTALRVSDVESSGVRGISEGKEKYKNMFFIVQEFAEKGEE